MSVIEKAVVFCLLGINVSIVSCTFYNVGVKYKVTLNLYSGRDNPEWEINEKNTAFNDITRALNKGPPTGMHVGLGYSGFTVEASNAIGQTAWKTVGRHTDRTLETLLLDSCPTGRLSKQAMRHINAGIYGQVKTYTTIDMSEDDGIVIKHQVSMYGRKKRQAVTCSTNFMPENWNYPPVQRLNNCYNYATNRQTNTFAQPGRASGRRYMRTTARDVYAASVRDGLTPLRTANAGTGCLIALVIWPGEDYHFLRLDNTGYWSQKSGRTRARNTDDSGNLIIDPRQADRGPYSIFAGFLGVTDNVVVQ